MLADPDVQRNIVGLCPTPERVKQQHRVPVAALHQLLAAVLQIKSTIDKLSNILQPILCANSALNVIINYHN